MSPIDPDLVMIEPTPPRPRGRAWGPITIGLAAFPIAFWVFGPVGILSCTIAVSSWWAYKLWPRKPIVEAPEIREFLRSAEAGTPSNPSGSQDQAAHDAPSAWDDLRF